MTGNLEKVEQTCVAWAQAYPRDAIPHGILGGVVYPVFGKYEDARQEASKAVQLNPDFSIGYGDLAFNQVYLGQLQQAENTLQAAAARALEATDALVLPHDIAFLRADRAAMKREAALEQSRSGRPGRLTCCKWPLAMSWVPRGAVFTGYSVRFTPSISAAWHFWLCTGALRRS